MTINPFSPFAILAVVAGLVVYPRVQHVVRVAGWLNVRGFETYDVGRCEQLSPAQVHGCEMIQIHEKWGVAFLACAHRFRRGKWWPPLGRRTEVAATNPPEQDPIFIYDLGTKALTQVPIVGMPTEYVSHGFSFFPTSEETIALALVNHAYEGSRVELADYRRGAAAIEWRETVFDPELISYPNSVAMTSANEFYVTNDHHYSHKWARSAEEVLALPVTTVVYHGANGTNRVAAGGLRHANGIAASADGRRVYVAETTGMDVVVFYPREGGELREVGRVHVGTSMDNMVVDGATGDVFLTELPKPFAFIAHTHAPKTANSPTRIVRLTNMREFGAAGAGVPEIVKVLEDDGANLRGITTGAGDTRHGVVVLGGPILGGAHVCPLDG